MTVSLSLRYVAPAARLSNAWDTRLGGALADAISCNAVVKAFGAEDARGRAGCRCVHRQVAAPHRRAPGRAAPATARRSRWRWSACAPPCSAPALWLWWQGRATPGDMAYVLTTSFVIQGYLREVGMHIRNLQRSVNDLEELIAFHDEPLGVADPAGCRADPHRARPGRAGARDLPLCRPLGTAVHRPRPDHPRRRARRPGRPFGLGQDHAREADPAALRRECRPHPDRRPGRGARHPGLAAGADRHRPAGAGAVPPLAGREHRLWPARRHAGRDRGRGPPRQRPRLHRPPAQAATPRWSASAASSCRAASASGWRWPAPSWPTPPS